MSTSDKDINRLTGKLLKEGMVKPSPDLSLRIMELIMQEEPLKVPEVKKARMIVGIIIAYLVVFAGVLMLLGQQSAGSVDHMLEGIKDKLPFIMTIAAIAGSLIFYSALDKVLALRF